MPTDQPVTDCTLPAIFKEFLQPARFKIAYGGRGSSKTRSVITILVNNVLWYGWRVMCFREEMSSIAESSYQEIIEEIERRNLSDFFTITKTDITADATGGVFKFSGLRASSNRLAKQKLKAMSNLDAAFIDEGESITKESWNALVPTMRKPNSEIYVCFNPSGPLDFVYQSFVSNPIYPEYKNGRRYCVTLKVNFSDNPFFPRELQDDAELMRVNDPELYRHVYLGEPVADNALSIIKPQWIEASIDAHLTIAGFPMGGGRIGGFDVSGGVEGNVAPTKSNDPNAFLWRHGCVVMGIDEWQDENPNSAAGRAYELASQSLLDALNVDDIGVGASVPGELRRLENEELARNHKSHRMNFAGWTASEGPMWPDAEYRLGKTNADMFLNLKAQGWGWLADRFRETWQAKNGMPHDPQKLISLPSGLPYIDKLRAELTQPRREIVNGRMKVESKASLKKRGIPSHNIADACVMAFSETAGGFDLTGLL